ncbi:MAG TPA: HaeIII family restriction endonuclease, partial [Fusibacter sp.]|nr:HaeIII family restriction endonuclease [Fusibacter sp.]
NEHCCHPIHAAHLFSFLVGKTDYYKIVFKESSNLLIIEEFSALILPNSVVAQADKNYVHLTFSNRWKISMRLHTASSQIKSSPALKFDTQPVEIFVSRQTIKI